MPKLRAATADSEKAVLRIAVTATDQQLIVSSMNSTASRPKKSPSSKAHKAGTLRCAVRSPQRRSTSRRRELRTWRASLPTALERDTLLMPAAIAASVVQEAERFLKAQLADDFAERLAARAHQLYLRHKHFHQGLNGPGNRGRDNLYMFMRHWTAGWLKRERNPLYKKLPREYAQGRRLPPPISQSA